MIARAHLEGPTRTCPPFPLCRHGPKRADWVSTFWRVLDWSKVSENYQAAQSADYASIAQ
jgi:hypothetical protein